MKRILSLLLCTVLLASPVTAFAIPLSSGDDALRQQFSYGGSSTFDYTYFAPELSDGKTYPLVIWVHGLGSGDYEGDQLNSYDLCKWASDEYQARFRNAEGAFILCPRSAISWDLIGTDALKSCINSFINDYSAYIDTSRIYIAGFSVGAVMVLRMVSDYPNFFAGAVPISAITQNTSVIRNMKNTAVWFFANEKDAYLGANALATRGSYNTLKEVIYDKSALRYTYLSEALTPDYVSITVQHYMWRCFTNDMFMTDGTQYANSTTIDGYGNTVTLTHPDGIISWLSSQYRNPPETSSVATGVWAKIVEFFNSIFAWIRGLFS